MIQKDIVNCFSKKIIKSTCDEIGKDVFVILVDESSDIPKKEQMTIVLRYNDRLGIVKERFIGVVHVLDISSLTLKAAIDTVFTDHNLSMAQLLVVAIANKHDDVEEFFEKLVLMVIAVCERGLNQEISLVRVGDTRCGSHYRTILSLLNLFAEVVAVLKYVKDERSTLCNRNRAKGIFVIFQDT
ncbi:uncharacterized protein LOC111887707 [Lactuca sativa]|uniref:uncharacterized protein LOC111887707 n=1 Tax=Lactuca sativa TaxID=4236 RepID=UPI000CD7E7A5|nr:uncharacterized protein LOC111887707 [Lactuca sativa]